MPEQDLEIGDGLGDAAVKPTDGDGFGEEKLKSWDYDSLAEKVLGRQPKDAHYDETKSQKPKARGSDVRNRGKNAKKVSDPFGDPYAGEAQPKKKNSARQSQVCSKIKCGIGIATKRLKKMPVMAMLMATMNRKMRAKNLGWKAETTGRSLTP